MNLTRDNVIIHRILIRFEKPFILYLHLFYDNLLSSEEVNCDSLFLFSLAPSIINSNDKFRFSLFYTKYKSLYGDRALPSEEFLTCNPPFLL
jgi:hypothetical protein